MKKTLLLWGLLLSCLAYSQKEINREWAAQINAVFDNLDKLITKNIAMKNTFLLLFITAFLSGCNSDDSMPAATQTGAETFACYVNGKPFINRLGWLDCFYGLIDGEYYFVIGGIDERYTDTSDPLSIGLETTKKTISEGEVLKLLERSDGNALGDARFSFSSSYNKYSSTNSEYSGELTITKLDFENRIVSGTFWFDIQHPKTGERVQIREGRFDALFKQ